MAIKEINLNKFVYEANTFIIKNRRKECFALFIQILEARGGIEHGCRRGEHESSKMDKDVFSDNFP